jgi:hypothetical protein
MKVTSAGVCHSDVSFCHFWTYSEQFTDVDSRSTSTTGTLTLVGSIDAEVSRTFPDVLPRSSVQAAAPSSKSAPPGLSSLS